MGALLAPSRDAPAEPVYPAPADDVAALGEVLRHMLRGGVPGLPAPGPLTAVVEACLAPDAAERPTAEQVARLVLEAVDPQPVALLAPPPDRAVDHRVGAPVGGIPTAIARRAAATAEGRIDELDAPGRRPRVARLRRALAVGATVVAVLAVLAGALTLALRHGDAPGRPVGQLVAAPPPDVPALVAVLAAGRARALATGSETALAVVDAPGSAAMADDTALVRRLGASGLRLAGLTFAVSDVRVVSADASGTTVEARVAMSAYEQVRGDGSVERRVPAAPPRSVRLTLVATPSGWRITSSR